MKIGNTSISTEILLYIQQQCCDTTVVVTQLYLSNFNISDHKKNNVHFLDSGHKEDIFNLQNICFPYPSLSKMEAQIVKDGGSNYQRWRLQIWRLQIVNNLATNPPFFLPC